MHKKEVKIIKKIRVLIFIFETSLVHFSLLAIGIAFTVRTLLIGQCSLVKQMTSVAQRLFIVIETCVTILKPSHELKKICANC